MPQISLNSLSLVLLLSVTAPISALGAAQTITFNAIPNQIVGVAPFAIAATASSGLSVSFTSTTPGVCKLAGNLVTLLSAGPCFITASQAGNGSYSAATPVTQGFTVNQAKAAGVLTLAAGSPFAAGIAPCAIASADLNGDGIPDIAALNGGGQLTVLLGNVAGGFTSATGSPFTLPAVAACDISGMATGDFNGDGVPDLVLSLFDRAVVFLGNGSGGFANAPGSPISLPDYAGVPVVGDFNGDGIQDLAVPYDGEGLDPGYNTTVAILLGNGLGQFSPAVNSPITFPKVNGGYGGFSVAVGDFNGDGIQDLAAVDSVNSALSLLLGNGSGGFTLAPGGPIVFGSPQNSLPHVPYPAVVAVGDFNGDGIQDVATSSYNSSVAVLLGNGAGGFTAALGSPFAVGTRPNALAEGDFNGDGIADLVVGGNNGSFVTVLQGNGSGGFTVASPFAAGGSPGAIAVGDFNGDGIEDVAVAEPANDNVAILLGGAASTTSVLSTTSPLSILPGQSVALTLNVSDAAGAFSGPTGTATFYDGSTLLGTSNQNSSPFSFSAAGLNGGGHTLTAKYGGDVRTSGSTSNAIAIQVETAQTITFGALSNVALGSGNVMLAATASSGLAASYASTTQTICTVSGASVTPVAFGTCSITASQNGDATYAPAAPVVQAFTISPVTPSVSSIVPNTVPAFSSSTPVAISGANFIDGATVLFTPPGGVAHTISPSLIEAAQIAATVPASFLTTAGTAQIVVNNGYAALSSPVMFTITAATQTIAFDSIPNQILGVSQFAIAAQASSLLPVSFTSSTPTVCKTAANLVMLLRVGTCSITANSNAATPAVRSFAVSAAKASGNFGAAAGSPFAVGTNLRSEPLSVAVGDFNGDGIEDLVTADFDQKTITVLVGDGTGGFTAATGSPIDVGTGPDSAAVGDFNGDGFQDIAVANLVDGTVTILLGNGAGGFSGATGSPFPAGSGPGSVTVGDFNGDGIQDLAMANRSTSAVTVLLGNGAGGFVAASGSPFAVGNLPGSLVVADFDGDGIQDLATANYGSDNLTVLLGNGAGGFTQAPGSPFAAGALPWSVAVGDFNNDGKQDLAATNYGSANITVLLGNGAGGFTQAPGGPFAAGSFPESIVVVDFDGDGNQDLAVANVNDNTVTLLEGDGLGGFQAAIESPLPAGGMNPASITVGDFNGDGIQDFAVANFGSGSVAVLLGIALGHTPQTILFGPQNGAVYGFPYTLSATASSGLPVSFTASGVCSVEGTTLTPRSFGPCTITAHQTGDATYAAAAPVTQALFIADPQTITFAALSDQALGSAPVTLVATASSGLTVSFSSTTPAVCTVAGNVATLKGAGQCSIAALQSGNEIYAAALVDQSFNVTVLTAAVTSIAPNTVAAHSGSAAVTIAGSNFVSGALISFTPPGGTTQTIAPSLVQAAQLMATIPAAFLTTAGTAQVLVTNGFTAFSNPVPFTITPALQTVTFDAIPNQILGGSPFVMAAKASSDLLVGFVSATPGVCKVAANQVLLRAVGTCTIAARQVGDAGYAAVSATRSFVVSYAKASGTLIAASGSPFTLAGDTSAMVVGDFNGDGIPDIATTGSVTPSSSNVNVLLGNGTGGFTAAPGIPSAPGIGPIAMATGDFNQDGFLDVAVANEFSSDVTVLLGDGTGSFVNAPGSPFAVQVTPYSSPVSIAVGDFNGDGIADLVTADQDGQNLSILQGNGQGGFTAVAQIPTGNIPYNGHPTAVAVGDFNGDGIQDLAAANYTFGNVGLFTGNGSAGFTNSPGSPFASGTTPQYLAVGDFNGDGVQDVAVANGGGTVTAFLGRSSGGFQYGPGSPIAIGVGPVSIAVGDFNGDGVQDLAVANNGGGITMMLGNGLGAFTIAGTFSTGAQTRSVAAADFNGDGIMDIAVVYSGSTRLTILLGEVARTESALSTTSPAAIAVGQSIALTLTVSGTTTTFSPPTGTVTFSDGTTVLGTANQTTGPYTFVASGLGLGTHKLSAAYSGDSRSSGSVSNMVTIQVLQAQTISFGALPDVPVGTAAFALSASSDSALAVSFASSTPLVCTVAGNMVTITASGGCSITASQAGDSTYAPATVMQKFTVFFSDVAPGDNDYAAINAMAQRGITAGCGSNGFCPNLNVTRDEMAIFIVRAIYGSDNFTYTTAPYFTDVTPTTFGFKWIQKLRDLGITSGCTATTYCPGAVVARDQMAVFIIRARLGLGIAGPSPTFSYPSTPYFTDATAGSEFAFPWIQRMKLDGITNGCTAMSYCPTDAVTRGQLAIFIMRGAFNQFLPAETPVISSISPGVLARGASGTFTVTGVNTNFVQGTTALSPIPGVTMGAVTITGPTSLTVQLTAASNAVAQPYSILAITGSEQDVLPNGLVLQ